MSKVIDWFMRGAAMGDPGLHDGDKVERAIGGLNVYLVMLSLSHYEAMGVCAWVAAVLAKKLGMPRETFAHNILQLWDELGPYGNGTNRDWSSIAKPEGNLPS